MIPLNNVIVLACSDCWLQCDKLHRLLLLLLSSISKDCDPASLWNLPAPDAVFTQDSAPDQNCNANTQGSSTLLNTTLSTATLACYNGTSPGSVAGFVCDDIYELNTTTVERVCQMVGNNATWSGNPVTCGKLNNGT